ncbi:MAG: hypothetical protein FWC27_13920 [Firmicutes bacterium]|nr:hypothetical protein [Bacillota bacterium]
MRLYRQIIYSAEKTFAFGNRQDAPLGGWCGAQKIPQENFPWGAMTQTFAVALLSSGL